MLLPVNDFCHLTEFHAEDAATVVAYLQEPLIHRWTLRLPCPYERQHFDEWFAQTTANAEKQGQHSNWAIRDAAGNAIGGIGFHDMEIGQSHRADFGYWLAKPFWGRGLMTAVVRAVCRHGFANLGLAKINAYVFDGNIASERVLLKSGFIPEGFLRKHHRKNGELIDAKVFGLVADELVA